MKQLTMGDMVAILCDDCRTMNDWELNFIDDMAKLIERKGTFTAAQIQKVRNIYFKYMEQ